jgi:UDP-N-acetylmuramoylalanine--D-glutamate ligase
MAAADARSAEPAESASPADDLPLDELIEGGGPPPHLIPPPPPGPVFEHLPQVWVLELSSFQLDGVHNFEPTAAAVLNVTQDHLDWHGTMAAYAAAKARIFGRQALMVINRDDAAVEAMVPQPPEPELGRSGKPLKVQSKTVRGWAPRRVQRFGLDAPRQPGDWGLSVENGMAWLVRAMEADDTPMRPRRGALREEEPLLLQRLMPADALRIRGRHNAPTPWRRWRWPPRRAAAGADAARPARVPRRAAPRGVPAVGGRCRGLRRQQGHQRRRHRGGAAGPGRRQARRASWW